ncbi:cysteine desulfurase family protein [Shouchella clausii]|uniref:cysteine desulfurase family protein n=1 Tax=Shouchella TaxID=2893057 RepID=UPI000BA68C19|nr:MULTISPECIES: cysteine desulfurase family protein [Shouchella]MCM3380534.1 cysteine desulfurase [Shouchella rhizosphaerae]PAE82570.1 cysteine desulfurase NifS [Shouchella clausii]
MIYLDNSATTRPHPDVLALYTKMAADYFGNASSLHTLGMEAEQVLDHARKRFAAYLNCMPNQLIFTSGGTEANAVAIQGTAKKHANGHLITTTVEHASIYENARALEAQGFEVTYVQADEDGRVTSKAIESAIRPNTVLVTLGHVQGELGTIQPIAEIGALLQRYPQIKFHVDAVQSLAKVPFSLKEANIDMLSLSAHKIHGLKGTGLLFVNNPATLESLLYGGGQEQRLRPGTENTAGVAAFAKALGLMESQEQEQQQRLLALNDMLRAKLEQIEGLVVNTPTSGYAPHILNVSIPGIKAEVLVQALGQRQIYVSTQSACSTKTGKPSRVLLGAMKPRTVAESAIRMSFSFATTHEEVEACAEALKQIIPELQEVVGK